MIRGRARERRRGTRVAACIAAVAAPLAFATEIGAATLAEKQMAAEMEECRASDPETATRGCTAVLDRGTLPDHVRWQALEFRAAAFLADASRARAQGRSDESEAAYAHALVDAEQLVRLAGRPERRAVARDLQGRALFGLRRWGEAIIAFDEALAADPAASETRADRARVLANVGDDERARADFDAVIAARRGQPTPLLDRGRFLFDRGRIRDALADFDHAVAYAPNSAVALYWRGRARSRLDDLDGAAADLDAAVYRDRTFTAALFERALLYEHTAQVDRALLLYRRAAAGPASDRATEQARRRLAALDPTAGAPIPPLSVPMPAPAVLLPASAPPASQPTPPAAQPDPPPAQPVAPAAVAPTPSAVVPERTTPTPPAADTPATPRPAPTTLPAPADAATPKSAPSVSAAPADAATSRRRPILADPLFDAPLARRN